MSTTAPVRAPCSLDVRWSAAAVTALLGRRTSAWWIVEDRLTFLARRTGDDPRLCCAIQTPLEPIASTGVWGVTVRVPRIRETILDVTDSNAATIIPPEVIRGPLAPAAPPTAEPLRGKLIPLAFASTALDETRTGTIYVPPDVPADARLPVIYLADGGTGQFAPILEAAIRDGRAAPAMIVGVDSADGFVEGCGETYCDRRNLEYQSTQGTGPTRPDRPFARHLRFVADELRPYVEATYPASQRREDRIVAGYSSGAAWAYAAAALRSELFGAVLGMSAGSPLTLHHAATLKATRVFTGAGLFEPSFLRGTRARAALARHAGADVRLREVLAGHSMAMWDILFADGVAWLLPPKEGR